MKRVLFSFILMLGASAVGSAQTAIFYFPQIAVGDSWRTTIFISNPRADKVASGTLTFTTSAGGPFNANWLDEMGNNVSGGSNSLSFQLGPGQSRKYISVGDMPLTVGYATMSVTADGNGAMVLGNAMFTLLDAAGKMWAEAGVPMAIALPMQGVFVDTTNGFRTGVAIANPNSNNLEVHFELMDDNGQMIATAVNTLGGFQHTAFFTDELFPGLGPMVGRLQYWCFNPMVSVALRFSPTVQFTTMPPMAISR
jgi:hypothetical protein